MAHVAIGAAITLAETCAFNVWSGNTGAVFNTGADDETYIYVDETAELMERWRGRGQLRNCNRRASDSSGEAKVDLKLAAPGAQRSCFNYHIRFRVRPSRTVGPTPEQVKATKRAQINRILNDLRQHEGKQPMVINWHDTPGEL